jgi:hypothetical protein
MEIYNYILSIIFGSPSIATAAQIEQAVINQERQQKEFFSPPLPEKSLLDTMPKKSLVKELQPEEPRADTTLEKADQAKQAEQAKTNYERQIEECLPKKPQLQPAKTSSLRRSKAVDKDKRSDYLKKRREEEKGIQEVVEELFYELYS